ncbi:MAG: acyl-CoA thioesterase, partial [Bacteroidetes bacterium]|nr:acyl-CoA thioesterase [Bacteroidota bacterium]
MLISDAVCQLSTRAVVTKKVSEIVFDNPAFQGDILEFYTHTSKVGKTSLTVKCKVLTKAVQKTDVRKEILNCEFVFVSIDTEGKPTPHGLT